MTAFLDGPGPVALSIFEWSGRFQQDVIIDWTLVTSEETLTTIAERVARQTRRHEDFPTALGYALGFAADRFQRAPPCLFQTLDISGDGQNNDGFPPGAAYEHFPLEGITVNGLAIGGASRGIEEYYLSPRSSAAPAPSSNSPPPMTISRTRCAASWNANCA